MERVLLLDPTSSNPQSVVDVALVLTEEKQEQPVVLGLEVKTSYEKDRGLWRELEMEYRIDYKYSNSKHLSRGQILS